MVRPFMGLMLGMTLVAGSATAAHWEKPDVRARLDAIASSDLFPGAVVTGSDRGAEGEVQAATARRLGAVKLGVEARAGAQAWSRFSEARSGWVGGTLSGRHAGTQVVLDAQWTPRRMKFTSDPTDGTFARVEWNVGLRQAFPHAVRARLELRHEDDDFVTAFDGRDGIGTTGFGRLDWNPVQSVRLRLEGERTREDAVSRKYTYGERVVGGGLAWSDARWSVEGLARSGVKRYDEALLGDSNFRRRDQWLETTVALSRRLATGLDLRGAFGLRDQTSSRVDRNHAVRTFALGLRWRNGE